MNKSEAFKQRILKKLDSVDIDFQIGYVYKRMIETEFKDIYWLNCYSFLKGLAHYMNIKTYR